MTFHPKARRTGAVPVDRRRFLQGSLALGVGAAGVVGLAACGQGSGRTLEGGGLTETAGIPLARRDNPVTLPISDAHPPIEDGLPPETGGVFKILNYDSYMAPGIMREFGEANNVEVEVTPYNNYDEMLEKIRAPKAEFDLVFPGPSVLSKMVYGELLQPLNKTYLPNFPNIFEGYQSPWYDVGALYTVPYTMYATGVGYRADKVDTVPTVGYDLFWDKTYDGQVYLLDDMGESLAMSMLRNNITNDINTTNPDFLNEASAKLSELTDLVGVKLNVSAYSEIPDGTATIHQAWSGDLLAAQNYLPNGVGTEVLGFWMPDTNRVTGNDVIAIPSGATKPVLAHMLINDLLDNEIALKNFSWNGYQPPLTALTPESLVSDGYVPASVENAVVTNQDVKDGLVFYELSAADNALWQSAWAKFKSGA